MDKETQPRRSSSSWSSSSPEPWPGQMHFAAHPTPSPRSPLYLAVPPHAAGIDRPAGSISRFFLRYLSAPSISQSALLSAMPVYTYSIYPRRLHRGRRYPFVWGISLSLHLGASPGPGSATMPSGRVLGTRPCQGQLGQVPVVASPGVMGDAAPHKSSLAPYAQGMGATQHPWVQPRSMGTCRASPGGLLALRSHRPPQTRLGCRFQRHIVQEHQPINWCLGGLASAGRSLPRQEKMGRGELQLSSPGTGWPTAALSPAQR